MAVPFRLDELTLFLDQASPYRTSVPRGLVSRRYAMVTRSQVSLISDLDATDAHGALNEDEPRGNSSAPTAERVKLMTVHASKARRDLRAGMRAEIRAAPMTYRRPTGGRASSSTRSLSSALRRACCRTTTRSTPTRSSRRSGGCSTSR